METTKVYIFEYKKKNYSTWTVKDGVDVWIDEYGFVPFMQVACDVNVRTFARNYYRDILELAKKHYIEDADDIVVFVFDNGHERLYTMTRKEDEYQNLNTFYRIGNGFHYHKLNWRK